MQIPIRNGREFIAEELLSRLRKCAVALLVVLVRAVQLSAQSAGRLRFRMGRLGARVVNGAATDRKSGRARAVMIVPGQGLAIRTHRRGATHRAASCRRGRRLPRTSSATTISAPETSRMRLRFSSSTFWRIRTLLMRTPTLQTPIWRMGRRTLPANMPRRHWPCSIRITPRHRRGLIPIKGGARSATAQSRRWHKRPRDPIIDISWQLESRGHSCSEEDQVHTGIAQARLFVVGSKWVWFVSQKRRWPRDYTSRLVPGGRLVGISRSHSRMTGNPSVIGKGRIADDYPGTIAWDWIEQFQASVIDC